MSGIINDLPYQLPITVEGQLKRLGKIAGIPNNLLVGGGEKEVEAIANMIMYRHLNRVERMNAMKSFHAVKKRALLGELVNNALDTAFVNPQWGIWSLTNSELEADIKFHNAIMMVSGAAGVGLSFSSAADFYKQVRKKRSLGTRGWVTAVIYGALIFNAIELSKANKEKDNRTTLNASRLYK